MELTLIRWCYGDDRTQGLLVGDGIELHTIERPWIPATSPGGKAYESCIPDGLYDLFPFTRDNGDDVWVLVNHDLGVYEHESEVPEEGGRFACLIHSANWSNEVFGCIAPGTHQLIDEKRRPMVSNSKVAMRKLHEVLDSAEGVITLHITPFPGASNEQPARE